MRTQNITCEVVRELDRFELKTVEEDVYLKNWCLSGAEIQEEIEIISNVYDNPELINPSND